MTNITMVITCVCFSRILSVFCITQPYGCNKAYSYLSLSYLILSYNMKKIFPLLLHKLGHVFYFGFNFMKAPKRHWEKILRNAISFPRIIISFLIIISFYELLFYSLVLLFRSHELLYHCCHLIFPPPNILANKMGNNNG